MLTNKTSLRRPDADVTRQLLFDLLPVWLLIAACSGFVGCGGDTPPLVTAEPDEVPQPGQARNVLVIVIDTLRTDHLGCYGNPRDTSPVVDGLAAEGMRFLDVVAQSPWTVPSTASILTSLYSTEHGAELRGEVRNLDGATPFQLHSDVETLADILDRKDFATGLFSANPFLYGRFKRGFDTAVVGRQPATTLSDAVIDWLDEIGDERFFAHIQYMDLHQPIEPPQPFFDMFEVDGGGERGEAHANWRFPQAKGLDTPEFERYRAHKLALYDGALRYVDTEIARVLEHLRGSGRLADTAILVTSDHGEEFWDHAQLGAELGGDPRGIYGIAHGQSMFQELLSVPLVLWGPGVPDGLEIPGRVDLLDVAPTVLGLLDVPTPPTMRGRSLLDPDAGIDPKAVIHAASPAYGPDSAAVFQGDWKYIWRTDGVELLYDLATDPGEQHDLATKHPERLAAFNALLEQHRERHIRTDESQPMVYDETMKEQLRALGYVQ